MQESISEASPLLRMVQTAYQKPNNDIELELSQIDSLGMVANDYINLLEGDLPETLPSNRNYVINDLLETS